MATMRAQVVIPYFTGIPTDVATNTFHFFELVPIGLPAVAAAVTPLLDAFYTTIYNSVSGIANYCTPLTAHVKWYDLSQPEPRVPLGVNLGLTSAVIASNLPTEVSAVLSFQGVRVAGQPQARRRGRIYVPGLPSGAVTNSGASAFPELLPALRAAMGSAASTLITASAGAGARWSVWSQVDLAAVEVDNGWIDNTPDTQRRRGVEATLRTLWS